MIEDYADGGLLSRLLHAADHGEHIRTREEWTRLLYPVLGTVEVETYRSGICPYVAVRAELPGAN